MIMINDTLRRERRGEGRKNKEKRESEGGRVYLMKKKVSAAK